MVCHSERTFEGYFGKHLSQPDRLIDCQEKPGGPNWSNRMDLSNGGRATHSRRSVGSSVGIGAPYVDPQFA